MIRKSEVATVLGCLVLLVALIWSQHQVEVRKREAVEVSNYNSALEYQHRERARERQNREIVNLFKDRYFNQIADAVYWAEGGADTKYPYGVKSVLVKDAAEARVVCLRTIANAWRRYESTDCNDFVAYLAYTYCPIAVDEAGNANWIKNVQFYIDNPKPLP